MKYRTPNNALLYATTLLGIVVLLNLGRSFGIMIAVRRVKTTGAYAVDSIRDGRIFALGINSYLYEVDPITGQAGQVASYFLDFPPALHATPCSPTRPPP